MEGKEPEISKAQSYWQIASDKLKIDSPMLHETLLEIQRESQAKLPENDEDESNQTILLGNRILSVVQKHKSFMEAKQWCLPSKVRGKEIKIQELLGQIFVSVKKFKEVGGALCSLDPTHAGLPWAAISLVVDVSLRFT